MAHLQFLDVHTVMVDLPDRLYKLLYISQQHFRLLHRGEMPTLIVVSAPFQIASCRNPANRNWRKLIRKPTITKGLLDVIFRIKVRIWGLWIVLRMT